MFDKQIELFSVMVKVNLKDITISGAGLPSTYTLEQLHFHWGEATGIGSEHLVDSVAHSLEVSTVLLSIIESIRIFGVALIT